MSTRKPVLVAGIAAIWSVVMGGAAALLVYRAPVELHLGSSAFVLAEPGELVALWALGSAMILGPLIRRRWLRLGAWALVLLACLVSLVWVIYRLQDHAPESSDQGPASQVAHVQRRTLLVAVDGMSWTAILPMLRRGELPNIARLMGEGSYGVLDSLRSYRPTVDLWGYWSPVVWTSMATGVRPQRHGILDFVSPADGKLLKSSDRQAPAFWNLYSAFGKRVSVVGWWATWPAEPISGYLVSNHVGLRGWRARDRHKPGLTSPEELADQLSLRSETPETVMDWVNREVFPFDRYPVLNPKELKTMYSVLWQDRLYLNVAKSLIETREPMDLFAVYFEGIDALSHQFWKPFVEPEDSDQITLPQGFREHTQIVPRYYRIVDSYIGDLLEILPEDVTVFVVSDHGFLLDPKNAKGANHSPFGVLIARGDGIARGRSINLDPVGSLREALGEPTGVLDILPTLLYLHGLPVARDLDGRVLDAIVERDYLDGHPLLQVKSYGDFGQERTVDPVVDPATSEEYRERLKMLGYIN